MIKRCIQGAVICLSIVLLPAWGNRAVLATAKPWILVSVGMLASLLQPQHNPISLWTRAQDKGTGAQIIWSVYLTQLAAVLEATYLRYPQSMQWTPITGIALLLALLGLALRTWSVFTLGHLFTMHIAIQENHSLVTTGPYHWMRHPSYAGAALLYLSTIVFLHAWYALILALILLPWAFGRRIHHEEQLLHKRLGPAYTAYCQTVNRILPKIG